MKTRTITTVGIFAALMCIISPFSVPIGPVPISLATLGVYIIASLFDWKKSTLIIIIYIVLGAIGVPVFSNAQGGFAVLIGPTGGYILGYILCALVESLLIKLMKDKPWSFPIAMIAGTVIIYVFGTAWFLVYMNFIKSVEYSLVKALTVCVIPFLIGDSIKMVIASLIGWRFKKYLNNYMERGTVSN